MNYKLEKFWNLHLNQVFYFLIQMNYKLEKFWNIFSLGNGTIPLPIWTINLKSFEITVICLNQNLCSYEL